MLLVELRAWLRVRWRLTGHHTGLVVHRGLLFVELRAWLLLRHDARRLLDKIHVRGVPSPRDAKVRLLRRRRHLLLRWRH